MMQRASISNLGWQKQLLAFGLLLLSALVTLLFLPPYTTSSASLSAPSLTHWLGTNDIGQDVLIGTLRAFPTTVFIALLTSALSLTIAILFASLAATQASWVSALILRIVDMLQVIPSILLMILFAAWFQPDFIGVIVLMAAIMWFDDIRILRTILLREQTRENIHYARKMGGSWFYCLSSHILPSVWPSLMGLFIQQVRQATMKVAGLGFLGLSDPNLVTWGSLMRDAMDYLYNAALFWLLFPPSLSLSAFLFFILTIGQHLEKISMAE